MATLRHVFELLVNPYFICLLLFALCLFLLWRRVYFKAARILLLCVFIVLLVISTGWLPRYLTNQLESKYPVVNQVNPEIEWVVVLSGGQNQGNEMPANDLLSSASIKRLVEGVRLYRALPRAKLILSGGGTVGDQPESLLLSQLTQWFDIPADKVVLEKRSINTADQAKELRSIVGEQPFYLVTSAIHMPRSMALCLQQGLHPVASPTDFTFFWYTGSWEKMMIPNSYNLAYLSIALHELLGRVWAFHLRGHG